MINDYVQNHPHLVPTSFLSKIASYESQKDIEAEEFIPQNTISSQSSQAEFVDLNKKLTTKKVSIATNHLESASGIHKKINKALFV